MKLTPQVKQELLTGIENANRILTDAHKQVCTKFITPIISNPNDILKLLKRLSGEFKSIQFTMVYDDRNQVVMAQPISKNISLDIQDIYLEQRHQELALIACKQQDNWSTFIEVQSYAYGFNAACESKQEIDKLKDQLLAYQKAERQQQMMFYPYGVPFGYR